MTTEKSSAVRVLIGGDVATDWSKAWKKADVAYSKHLLSELRPHLDAADFRLCNLENVLCEEGLGAPIVKGGPNLRGEPEEIGFLTVGGFDAVFLANNHLGDYGPEPILDTIRRLDEVGIGHCGGGKNLEEAYAAWYAEKNGIKIAFISVCENEFGGAEENFPGSAGYNVMKVRTRILEEKKKADFVVLVFHGGQEFNPVAGPSHVDRYRVLATFGADAVVGMHTHCIQGTEIFEGTPIIYSMGNLYFNGYHNGGNLGAKPDDPWNYGYMTELSFEKGKPVTFRLIPYHLEDGGELIHVFEGEDKEKMLAYIDRLSAIIQDPIATQRLYDAWCTRKGIEHTKMIPSWKDEFVTEPAEIHTVKVLRNLHTCEAHNAMITRTAHLLYKGRIQEAEKAWDELKALSKLPV